MSDYNKFTIILVVVSVMSTSLVLAENMSQVRLRAIVGTLAIALTIFFLEVIIK